ncbi:hypothetical protein C7212DRAFT_343674 [Tuber magnatum]|uniref:Uncharacterized protein n=1 Tax=Tuber magnatum TaxID=42249 RepID=A0A317STP5_9PEZI|nr:hypothetical protein C7212DRAFT_343674 [Tuber magnatum]
MGTPALPLFDAIRGVMAGSWPEDEYDLAESPLSYVDYRKQKPECGEPVTITAPSITISKPDAEPESVVAVGEPRPESEGTTDPTPEAGSESKLGTETRETDIDIKGKDYVDASVQTDGSWLKAMLGFGAPRERAIPTSTLQSGCEEDRGTVLGTEAEEENNLLTRSRRNTLVQTEGTSDLDLLRPNSSGADSTETLSINSDGPTEVSTAVQVRIFSSPPPSSVTTLSLDRHDSGFFPTSTSRPQTPPSKANSRPSLPPSPPPSPPSMRRQAVVVGQSLIERKSTDSTTSTTSTRIISIENPQPRPASIISRNFSTTSVARPRISTSSLAVPNSLYSSPKSSRFFEDLSDEVRPGTAASVEELARQSEPRKASSIRPDTAMPSMQSEKIPTSPTRPATAPSASTLSKGKPKKLKLRLPKGCGLKFSIPKWAKKSSSEKKRVVSYESTIYTTASGKT